MPTPIDQLQTERTLLRRWRDSDREPYAAMNADAEVMEYFPRTLSRDESDALIDGFESKHDEHGFGVWALELRSTGGLIGQLGLAGPLDFLPGGSRVEILWRLARHAWGKGLASEAARSALAAGFDKLGLEEIVAITAVTNRRSMAVMERIGMRRDPSADFDHPKLPDGHPLQPHVLYRTRPTGH